MVSFLYLKSDLIVGRKNTFSNIPYKKLFFFSFYLLVKDLNFFILFKLFSIFKINLKILNDNAKKVNK